MTALLRKLWRDDAGLILSAEMIIILTITVLGMVVGLVNLQNALLGEFTDLGLAFRSLNQSYGTPSYRGCWKYWGRTSWVAGSCFVDAFDGCVANTVTGCYGSDIASGGNCYPTTTTGSVVAEPTVINDPCPTNSTSIPAPQATPSPAIPCPSLPLPKTGIQ